MSLTANVSCAIWLTAVTWLWIRSIAVDIVVEDELLARSDLSLGKNPHAQFIADDPLVNIAIRIAGMITEPSKITFFSGINEFIFREGHEIEVLDALIVVLNGPATELSFVDDLTNIFENEFMRIDIGVSP